jgi:predicted glycosyltransferase/DNA-binding NarL/FixJ family response regulator
VNGARKVLIVEDERIVQMHLARIVEAYGHAVSGTATTRDEALAAAAGDPPDIALMDVRLAGGDDGIAVAEALHRRHGCSVVFVTAHADMKTVGRAGPISSGYVVKPFAPGAVGAAVTTALVTLDRDRRAREIERELAEELGRREDEMAGERSELRAPFQGPTRMMVYSHDTLGLGHLRRCQNVIRGLAARFPELSTLLVTGSPAAHKYELPPRTDYLKLPAVRKVAPESYAARSLGMSDAGILDLRKNLLLRTVRDYRPDVLLVDHAPIGMKGELLPTLEHVHRRGTCTRILGLRDVIDDPARVRAQWEEQGTSEVLRWGYDHVVVYGAPEVYDTVTEYAFPEDVARKTRSVGYVSDLSATDAGDASPRSSEGPRRIVLTIGGGDGGWDTLIDPFLAMLRTYRARLNVEVETLLGPFVPDDVERRLRAAGQGLPITFSGFVQRPPNLFASADLVVATAGYNTSVEVLAHAQRAILVPRVLHRDEQLIRARRLEEMGLVVCVHPDEATPQKLYEVTTHLLLADPALARAREDGVVPLDGATRLAELFAGMAR